MSVSVRECECVDVCVCAEEEGGDLCVLMKGNDPLNGRVTGVCVVVSE